MNYKMNKKYVCEICNIRTRRVENSKRTFMAKFPLDVDRCKQWVKVIGKEDLVYVPIQKLHQLKYVCGEHFKPTDFKKKRTQLKKNAVPSLGISTQPLTDEMLSGFPLHVSTSNSTIDLSAILAKEHNYFKPLSIAPVLQTKRTCSPPPSTSTSDTATLQTKRSCSPRELLLHRLSYLLIGNECHIINQSFALTEEASADSLKKAQQQAIAK